MAQDTLLGFPAHTLPYRRGEFATLLTVSGPCVHSTQGLFDGIGYVGQSDQLFKIEEGLVLSVPPHTGGQHLVGCLIFLVALCHDSAQVHLIQTPFRSTPESLGAVAVSSIGLIDPAEIGRAHV